MPWKETTAMSLRFGFVQLASQEVANSIRKGPEHGSGNLVGGALSLICMLTVRTRTEAPLMKGRLDSYFKLSTGLVLASTRT